MALRVTGKLSFTQSMGVTGISGYRAQVEGGAHSREESQNIKGVTEHPRSLGGEPRWGQGRQGREG